ncbi:MAG TPA: DNA-formamidopyrimidine glycosylase family protein [Longimicrobiales bacterium]|nr:DNA-formamidopyrimidine glycosylase family protein [Longimicrobiales bacterium]
MPEGDTVHRIARVLGAELPGQTLTALELHDRGAVPELAGRTIESVEAVGKHLLVGIAGGWTLRVHLGMHGRWLRKHARERRPSKWTVILTSGETAYVCEGAYRAELLRTSALRAHPRLGRLGPDLLADPPRIDEMVRRARLPAYAEREVGDALLDQRIAAGTGNVYKSEVLFECRVHPRAKLRELSDEQLTTIFQTAAKLMRLNLLTRRRTSVPLRRRDQPTSQRLWVYMRGGRPCLDCGTPIERLLQGDMARSTYFCPRCQSASP